MKINFALIGLGAAQSGDGRESDYDYPAANEDRWEFNNGVTFTDFTGKTSGQQTAADFVLAMKLSCWNSNMIRDMNNDNKFQLYTKGASAVNEDTQTGWSYAKGDLNTGMNHQFGFEPHGPSQAGSAVAASSAMDVIDTNYAQRVPASKDTFHKWGYQTDGVNRAASEGYAANTVVYHFGHGDNKDASANRPFSYDNDGTGFPSDAPIFKDDWRFSLRMGGCLYEATEWLYDATSFNQVGRLTYTGDRDFAASAELFGNTDYTSAGSFFADVHWVHVFNAHIFPARNTGYVTASTSNDSIIQSSGQTEAGASEAGTVQKTARNIEDFNVVMANPTYEGHGFLNFVATYHDHVDIKSGRAAGFGYAGYRFRSTIGGYTQYDNALETECAELRGLRASPNDPVGGVVDRSGDARCGSAIYENFGDWYLRPAQSYDQVAGDIEYWGYIMKANFDTTTDALWSNAAADYRDTSSTFEESMRGFAISSFPHNELGQDFRFNIRTLHNMGGGVANTAAASNANTEVLPADVIWSYYFYAVDSIKIAFPEYVARVNHCHFKDHLNNPMCQTTSTTGHDGWQQIIIDGTTMKETTAPSTSSDTRYQDQKTQYGFTHNLGRDAWKASLLMDDTGSNFANDNINTAHCASTALDASAFDYENNLASVPEDGKPRKPCASWCLSANAVTRGVCGRILEITGLLQTYDELHLRQYGTIQEVWVQLMYAYVESLNESAPIKTGATSTQAVESPFPNVFFSAPEVVGLVAACDNVNNYKCRGYRTYENQPYGGSETYNQRVFQNNAGATSPGAGADDYHADSLWASNDITADFTRK